MECGGTARGTAMLAILGAVAALVGLMGAVDGTEGLRAGAMVGEPVGALALAMVVLLIREERCKGRNRRKEGRRCRR